MPEPQPSLADWLGLLEQRHPRSIDLGLERCGQVYRRLGAPRPGGRIVTVAGTNGKGSAVAWLESLLDALGHSVAAYTSPHILRFNERLRINRHEVRDAELVQAFGQVERARGDVSLTYFEFTTLACMLLMHRASPDFALLEVGLGGRLDTVNLVDADLALIMPVGLDHQDYLGDDREQIGAEKAGIMRRGLPVVCAEAHPPASVLEWAEALGCPVYRAERDFRMRRRGDGLRFEMGKLACTLPALPLPGWHQPANLAAALAALRVLCGAGAIREPSMRRGVGTVRLAGRLQALEGDPRILLDVGHNPLAAQAVARYLAETGRAACHCVLGMLADKDAEGVASALGPQVAHWYCASLGGNRGQSGESLVRRVAGVVGKTPVHAYQTVALALDAARRAAPGDATVLVFGSFETAAAALRVLTDSDC